MGDRYPSDWDSRRKNVYRRDNHTCQNCGERGGIYGDAKLHAHHNVPISKGGSHKISNLTTLCKGCHDAIHHNHKIAPTGHSAPDPSIEWSDIPKPSATAVLKFCAWAIVFVLLAAVTGPAVIITFPVLYYGIKKSDGTFGFRDPRKAFDFDEEEDHDDAQHAQSSRSNEKSVESSRESEAELPTFGSTDDSSRDEG